jgi:hypothetical protein
LTGSRPPESPWVRDQLNVRWKGGFEALLGLETLPVGDTDDETWVSDDVVNVDDSLNAERRACYEEAAAAVAAGSTWHAEYLRLVEKHKQKDEEAAAEEAAALASFYGSGPPRDPKDDPSLGDLRFVTELLPDGSFTIRDVPDQQPRQTPVHLPSKWI